jgi:hypothetical protein
MHNYSCFDQSCDQSVLRCGPNKFDEYFGPLAGRLGHMKLELHQHIKDSYIKPDGSKVSTSKAKIFRT